MALIFKDRSGENMIAVAAGSNGDLRPEHVTAAASDIRDAGCVMAQLEVPLAAVREAARLASGFGVPMLLNPAPAVRLEPELLAYLTLLTPNQVELALLTGQTIRQRSDIPKAARPLRQKGVNHVIVTCGAAGVCWCSDSVTAGSPHPGCGSWTRWVPEIASPERWPPAWPGANR